MFYDFFLRSFRLLLLPIAIVYWAVIYIRNYFYDKQWLHSAEFGIPLITVGNLAVGGTGKSPLIELLVEFLSPHYKVATLSRGYRRRTRGYAFAKPTSTALDIGDEPLSFFRKFPNIAVTVGEERVLAIPELLHDFPSTEVILLDDAFQHRSIRAGFTILLTEYANLFTRDFYLPTGDLRDLKSRYKDATIIIVTKCSPDLSIVERDQIIAEINPLSHQKVYFTFLEYGLPYHIITHEPYPLRPENEIVLVTGISNPKPLKRYVEEHSAYYRQLQYRDHHIFTIEDFDEIEVEWRKLNKNEGIILTTEKDAVRLEKFSDRLIDLPFYSIPVCHRFLFNAQLEFERSINFFIDNFKNRE
jgi:tetraacyldisaccharide 4'-kinase